MVEVKHRIAGAHVRVRPRVPADGVVSPAVQSERKLEEVGEGLEVIVAGDEGDDVGWLGGVGEEKRDVSLEAAGVVIQSGPVADFGPVCGGAEIDDVVGKGTSINAAAASRRRDGEVNAESADVEHGMRDGFAVAAHRVDGAIKLFGL